MGWVDKMVGALKPKEGRGEINFSFMVGFQEYADIKICAKIFFKIEAFERGGTVG